MKKPRKARLESASLMVTLLLNSKARIGTQVVFLRALRDQASCFHQCLAFIKHNIIDFCSCDYCNSVRYSYFLQRRKLEGSEVTYPKSYNTLALGLAFFSLYVNTLSLSSPILGMGIRMPGLLG